MKNKLNYKKAAILVIAFAIVLRIVLSSIYTVSGDACWHYSVSKFIAEEGSVPFDEPLGRDEPFWAPPLFHYFSAFMFGLLGETGMKLIPVIFGSMYLVLSYFILNMFLSKRSFFYGIVFLSFIPIFIDYSVLGYAEAMLTFLVGLSLYFALKKNFLTSGIIAGFAVLTKYNGVFVIPILFYLVFRNFKGKKFVQNSIYVTVIPGLIGLPWFIRNWIELGNPIWPFLNFIFGGYEKLSYSGLNFGSLLEANTYISTYLGLFGVPNGNYQLFFFFDIPFLLPLLSIFLIGTLLFVLPLVFGFRSLKKDNIFILLLASFVILFLMYVVNVGPYVTRMLLPAFIGLAFFYGRGIDFLLNKYKHLNKLFPVLILAICVGFAAVEFVKFSAASGSWNSYSDDFEWVKENTEPNSIFVVGGQCVQYHIDRLSYFPSELGSRDYDYVWVNDDFPLDKRSEINDDILKEQLLEDRTELYSNKETGTSIFG